MQDFKEPWVTFTYKKEKHLVDVVWGIVTLSKEEEGVLSCYLPGYDVYFSAKDIDSAEKKAIGLTQIYFRHFVYDKKRGLKSLALELHRLGFKAPKDALTLSKILKNKGENAKFKAQTERPQAFANASISEHKSEIAMSI